MKEFFGIFVESGEFEIWKIICNVIWDLYCVENKLMSVNKEVIYGIVSCGLGKFLNEFYIMCVFGLFWIDVKIKGLDGKFGVMNFVCNNVKYNKKYDFVWVIGCGIVNICFIYFVIYILWQVNGMDDKGDLCYSVKVGNWFFMDLLKYNDLVLVYYGKMYVEVCLDCL